MAEVGKIKPEKQGEEAMTYIRKNIDNTIINDIYPPLTQLDSGNLYFPSSSAAEK